MGPIYTMMSETACWSLPEVTWQDFVILSNLLSIKPQPQLHMHPFSHGRAIENLMEDAPKKLSREKKKPPILSIILVGS